MKNIFDVKRPRLYTPAKVDEEPKWDFRLPPSPINITHQPKLCRIVPKFVMDNYELFQALSLPRKKIRNPEYYITKIKQKIICEKAKFEL